MNENKKRALEAAISKIEKDFGRGSVLRYGDSGNFGEVEVVPTGSLSLDYHLQSKELTILEEKPMDDLLANSNNIDPAQLDYEKS